MPNQILLTNPVRPTWKWDFTTGKAPSGTTYTGSGGTYFDSSGVLTSATTNVPRFDYDPATLSPLGYLAEMASTNRVTQSRDFSGYTNTNVTQSQDGTKGPDGAASMYKITASAGAGDHFTRVSVLSVNSGDTYSISFVVKQGTARYVTIGDDGAASWHIGTFDLNIGTWSNQTNVTGEARQLANGLWRIGVKITASSTHTARAVVGFGPVSNNGASIQNFTAAGTETGYALETQLETGGVGITSIIPTAGATASRTQDVLSLPLTSLPGWSATQGGVLVAAYRLHTLVPSSPGYSQTFLQIHDGSNNNIINSAANYGGTLKRQGVMVSGGSTQFNSTSDVASVASVSTRTKQALGYGAARWFLVADGGTGAGASGSFSLPVSPTTLLMGTDRGGQALNGTLESIAYYKGARSDAFVQAVSR